MLHRFGDWPGIGRKSFRVSMGPVALSALVAAVLLIGYNRTFWALGLGIFSGHPVQLFCIMLAIFFLTLAFFSLFSFRALVRPFLAVMIVLTAVTSYYMDTLGVVIDREMVQNVVTTTFNEGKHLLTAGFVLHVLLLGGVPAALLLLVRVPRRGWGRTLAVPAVTFTLSIALAAGLLFSNFKTYAAVLRERKDFMSSYQPGAPLVGAVRFVRMVADTATAEVTPLGQDAARGRAYVGARKPVLTVIVAGETARAQNFSLDGYARDTNPELARRDIVNFTDVRSCGTATAVSLPCMFSNFDRGSYTYEKGVETETLLDVLSHAGFDVAWWDNNTGDKGIARRVGYLNFADSPEEAYCGAGECTDGIMLDRLAAFLPTVTRDTVLVLHQIGSHGPTYFLRYPPEFEKFTPACRTAEFKDCTADQIVNAYDNTILYTDHILSQIIDMLGAQENVTTSLLYVSDHGESLGEGGLYLHGAPYFMAPDEQTKVPMLLWLSDGFRSRFGIDQTCLAQKRTAALSHDNLFHSVLGMLDVTTEVHDSALDIFTGCAPEEQIARN